jgi:hypothetical protein
MVKDYRLLDSELAQKARAKLSEFLTEEECRQAITYIESTLGYEVEPIPVHLPLSNWAANATEASIPAQFSHPRGNDRSYMGFIELKSRSDYDLPFPLAGFFFDPLEHRNCTVRQAHISGETKPACLYGRMPDGTVAKAYLGSRDSLPLRYVKEPTIDGQAAVWFLESGNSAAETMYVTVAAIGVGSGVPSAERIVANVGLAVSGFQYDGSGPNFVETRARNRPQLDSAQLNLLPYLGWGISKIIVEPLVIQEVWPFTLVKLATAPSLLSFAPSRNVIFGLNLNDSPVGYAHLMVEGCADTDMVDSLAKSAVKAYWGLELGNPIQP